MPFTCHRKVWEAEKITTLWDFRSTASAKEASDLLALLVGFRGISKRIIGMDEAGVRRCPPLRLPDPRHPHRRQRQPRQRWKMSTSVSSTTSEAGTSIVTELPTPPQGLAHRVLTHLHGVLAEARVPWPSTTKDDPPKAKKREDWRAYCDRRYQECCQVSVQHNLGVQVSAE